ncbi:MAG TPA: hypothetical protein VFX33_11705 [Actinomycetales bacterium]|nr:hypothetical protein [Actinomycetales bacterium]
MNWVYHAAVAPWSGMATVTLSRWTALDSTPGDAAGKRRTPMVFIGAPNS